MDAFASEDVARIFAGLGLLIPGALIVYVRSLFLTGRRQLHREATLTYVIISILYLALALPAFTLLYNSTEVAWLHYVLWVLLILVIPLATGILIGAAHQHEWLGFIRDLLRLKIVHPMPTAWDRMFGMQKPQWLVVRLKDGSSVLGYYGGNSFASSDPSERDVYIERVYLAGTEGRWQPTKNGILLQSSQIASIEFMEIEE